MSYASWHVGMKVVCVDAKPRDTNSAWFGDAPIEGKVYTISRLFLDDEGEPVCAFEELERCPDAVREGCVGYGCWRFRPVQPRKTDISIFTTMLHDAPLQKELS
jgi:hypothetical protein